MVMNFSFTQEIPLQHACCTCGMNIIVSIQYIARGLYSLGTRVNNLKG